MNRFAIAVMAVGVVSVVGLSGCAKPIPSDFDPVLWCSLASSPLALRFHPSRWDEGKGGSSGPNASEYETPLKDVIEFSTRPPGTKTKYGPLTVLSIGNLELSNASILYDRHGKPVWAGRYVFPLRKKGKLESLILVEQIPRPQEYQVDTWYMNTVHPFSRFLLLDMRYYAGKEDNEPPLRSLGVGFVVTFDVGGLFDPEYLATHGGCIVDITGKGDDLLPLAILDFQNWRAILADRIGATWRLAAVNALGDDLLDAEVPKDVEVRGVLIGYKKTSPTKITLSALKDGSRKGVWKTVVVDPNDRDTWDKPRVDTD